MKKFRILIADDDLDDFLMIQQAFNELKLDHILEHVIDGKELLNFLYSSRNVDELRPDLILLDINMPKINGIQALQELRSVEAFNKIPVIMHSTASHFEQIKKCYKSGATAYVIKGDSYRVVLELARDIVNFLSTGAELHTKITLKLNKLLI